MKTSKQRHHGAIDYGVLAQPKGEPRARSKGRARRQEAALVQVVRPQCVARDGYCRISGAVAQALRMRPMLVSWLVATFGACAGASEWSHYNASHRRSKTRGMAPEQRHDRKHSLMLCTAHSGAYDQHRMDIEELTPDGCDGPLRFSCGGAVWEEDAA